jgi:hypothetical protein
MIIFGPPPGKPKVCFSILITKIKFLLYTVGVVNQIALRRRRLCVHYQLIHRDYVLRGFLDTPQGLINKLVI